MKSARRLFLTVLIAVVTSLGAFALAGCTDDAQQAQSSSTQTTQEAATSSDASDSAAADDEEQADCYGDDLPATK